jgi:predicted ABC-type ATPase
MERPGLGAEGGRVGDEPPRGAAHCPIGYRVRDCLLCAGQVDFLERAKAADYFVSVFFVSTTDVKINASRVMGRYVSGGHSVPIDKIAKRYTKSMANLAAAIELADRGIRIRPTLTLSH